MARRAFFSFHYQRDIWRVNQVRNSWLLQPGQQEAVWYDASLWEKVKMKGELALKRLINDGLSNTSVTIVLIGAETSQRKWVNYEIEQSHNLGKGLLGIYIHSLKDVNKNTDIKGQNPFNNFYIYIENEPKMYLLSDINEQGKDFISNKNHKKSLSELYPTYDWILDDGYKNIGSWIETAAKQAGR